MQLLKKIQVPFSWQILGSAATWTFVWPLWVIPSVQEGNPEYTYKLYLGKVPSFVVHRGLWHVKGHKMAFNSLIPGAGGSYTLTQSHSFMRMGNVVNTWMNDVSLSGVISLGLSCARHCMDPRELSLPWCLQEWGLWRAQVMGGGETAKHKGCVAQLGCLWQGHGPTNLGSLLLCYGALLLPRSSSKQEKSELPQLELLPCCIARLSCSGGALPQQCFHFHKMPCNFFFLFMLINLSL